MEKLQALAMIQAYTGIGIGLMIGVGAAGEGIPAARFDRRLVHHRGRSGDDVRICQSVARGDSEVSGVVLTSLPIRGQA